MTTLLYGIIDIITKLHNWFLTLNDSHELYFSDKELHFLVIGLVGMALVFIIHPLFHALAKTDHVMVITWLYVFTIILVITFAIEIGQRITGSGKMEFADIQFGIAGFIVLFAIFAIIRGIIKLIISLIRKEG